MAWTTSDLDAVKTARASGVLAVRHADGRMVTYKSDTDMARVQAAIERELEAEAAGGSANVRRFSFAGYRPG